MRIERGRGTYARGVGAAAPPPPSPPLLTHRQGPQGRRPCAQSASYQPYGAPTNASRHREGACAAPSRAAPCACAAWRSRPQQRSQQLQWQGRPPPQPAEGAGRPSAARRSRTWGRGGRRAPQRQQTQTPPLALQGAPLHRGTPSSRCRGRRETSPPLPRTAAHRGAGGRRPRRRHGCPPHAPPLHRERRGPSATTPPPPPRARRGPTRAAATSRRAP